MTEIPEHLKQRAKKAVTEAATRAATDAVIDQVVQIPAHLLMRAKAMKESGNYPKIPEHLLKRAEAARQTVLDEAHRNFGGGHYKDECIHGVVVKQCRCPGPKSTVTVPCPSTCTGPVEVEEVEEDPRNLLFGGALLREQDLQARVVELEGLLKRSCLALLANDVELPKGVKEWFYSQEF